MNLTQYKAIQSNLFVRIQVDYYKETAESEPIQEVLRFSDNIQPYTLDGEEYLGLGKLVGITSTNSELRASSGDLTITISGIPNSSIYEIVNSKIKGCPVRITRVLFNPATGLPLNIAGNPLARYRGFVNNYSLQEDWDQNTRTSSNTIVLVCASSIDVLSNKVGGRKTNPYSMKRFYPNDLSFDRVPTLENTTFNFGAPL